MHRLALLPVFLRIVLVFSAGTFTVGCVEMMMIGKGLQGGPANPYHVAACKGDRLELESLLGRGYSAKDRFGDDGGNALNSYIDCQTDSGKPGTPVDLKLVEYLLEVGADPNIANRHWLGRTPLAALAASPWIPNRFEAIDLLIRSGATVEPHDVSKGAWEKNPLVIAARNSDIEMLRFLIARGAPIRSKELSEGFLTWGNMRVCAGRFQTPEALTTEQSKKLSKARALLDVLFANGFVPQEPYAGYLRTLCYEAGKDFVNLVYPYVSDRRPAKPN